MRTRALCVCAWSACVWVAAAWLVPAGSPRCVDVQRCQFHSGAGRAGLNYVVDDKTIEIKYSDGDVFNLSCKKSDVLGSAALPSFSEALRVRKLELVECVLPPDAIRDTLLRLNVTLLPCAVLRILRPPAAPPLSARHLAGLPLGTLEVRAAGDARLQPAPGFLRPLAGLRDLLLERVALPAAELDALPGLRRLELRMEDEDALDVAKLPPSLEELTLVSANTSLRVGAAPALHTLVVEGWQEPARLQCARCPALRSLSVSGAALGSLRGGWLARWPRLQALRLRGSPRLRALPAWLLAGASSLRSLHVSGASLENRVATELLDDTPALSSLELYGNNITGLQRSTFAKCTGLLKLDLSHNALDASSLDVLAPLVNLTHLNLSHNTRISDTCATHHVMSKLSSFTRIQILNLSYTNVTRICRDWRQDMKSLIKLDLSHTKISELWFHELPSTADRVVKDATVVLDDIPLKHVGMSREYFTKLPASLPIQVELRLEAPLACDCRMYWTRRALPLLPPWVGELTCADGPLRELPPADMLCPAREECAHLQGLPAACACSHRPHERATWRVVRVRCERAGLRQLPRPAPGWRPPDEPQLRRRYELQLRNNSIDNLNAADLYDNIEGLDLRDNELHSADERLGRVAGELQLAGNPLDCSCDAAPLLSELLGRGNSSDLANMTCAGGGRLQHWAPATCTPAASRSPLIAALAGTLAVLLALAILAVVALASPSRRFFVKAVLLRWGCLWRAAEPAADRARPYDAFVTFAQEDEAAAAEVVRRLEPTYRLCVHHRDWVAGLPIAQQIAESVARSRRTLALVSRHYQHSRWTRAEFQQAHAAALRGSHRLVVVLLEEPAALPPDRALRRYLASTTYVRWADPWLWHKLRVALPPPRPSHPPAPQWRPSHPPPAKRPRDPAPRTAAVSPCPAEVDPARPRDPAPRTAAVSPCPAEVDPARPRDPAPRTAAVSPCPAEVDPARPRDPAPRTAAMSPCPAEVNPARPRDPAPRTAAVSPCPAEVDPSRPAEPPSDLSRPDPTSEYPFSPPPAGSKHGRGRFVSQASASTPNMALPVAVAT